MSNKQLRMKTIFQCIIKTIEFLLVYSLTFFRCNTEFWKKIKSYSEILFGSTKQQGHQNNFFYTCLIPLLLFTIQRKGLEHSLFGGGYCIWKWIINVLLEMSCEQPKHLKKEGECISCNVLRTTKTPEGGGRMY